LRLSFLVYRLPAGRQVFRLSFIACLPAGRFIVLIRGFSPDTDFRLSRFPFRVSLFPFRFSRLSSQS
jgi:hypothetical protein